MRKSSCVDKTQSEYASGRQMRPGRRCCCRISHCSHCVSPGPTLHWPSQTDRRTDGPTDGRTSVGQLIRPRRWVSGHKTRPSTCQWTVPARPAGQSVRDQRPVQTSNCRMTNTLSNSTSSVLLQVTVNV